MYVKALIVEQSPSLLSMGRLQRQHGIETEWKHRQPTLTIPDTKVVVRRASIQRPPHAR